MQQRDVRTATVLIPPHRDLLRLSIREVDVGGLAATTTAVIPVVDDERVIEIHLGSVVGGDAEVEGFVDGRVNPPGEPDDDILADVGAHDGSAAPLVFDAWCYSGGNDLRRWWEWRAGVVLVELAGAIVPDGVCQARLVVRLGG
jgi:hypothetical protein